MEMWKRCTLDLMAISNDGELKTEWRIYRIKGQTHASKFSVSFEWACEEFLWNWIACHVSICVLFFFFLMTRKAIAQTKRRKWRVSAKHWIERFFTPSVCCLRWHYFFFYGVDSSLWNCEWWKTIVVCVRCATANIACATVVVHSKSKTNIIGGIETTPSTRIVVCMIDGSAIFVVAADWAGIFRYRCRWRT